MESSSPEEDSLYNEVGNYLFTNEKVHDVVFIVGEEQEKISAVKILLINQSRAWWSMLSEDSPLAEKGDIHLPDIEPEVFQLLLRHCYGGLESLDDLTDEVVIKLCYCANKYFMKALMTKIAARLEPKDVESLFPALHCLAYYNLQGVEESVKKIIQTKTLTVLEHPDFLDCDIDSITYICKQDDLKCDELSLWSAVVKWAKHKAQGDEGAQLRQWMCEPLQHLRLLSLSEADFYRHVLPMDILNSKEIAGFCKGDLSDVPTLCNKKEARYIEMTVDIQQNLPQSQSKVSCHNQSYSSILIKDKSIVLKSIVVRSNMSSSTTNEAFNLSKKYVNLTLTISRVANEDETHSTSELCAADSVSLRFDKFEYDYYQLITIPTLINNRGITLLANSKYKIELSFNQNFYVWCEPDCSNGHDFDHGTFYCSWNYNNGIGQTACHIQKFTYGVAVR